MPRPKKRVSHIRKMLQIARERKKAGLTNINPNRKDTETFPKVKLNSQTDTKDHFGFRKITQGFNCLFCRSELPGHESHRGQPRIVNINSKSQLDDLMHEFGEVLIDSVEDATLNKKQVAKFHFHESKLCLSCIGIVGDIHFLHRSILGMKERLCTVQNKIQNLLLENFDYVFEPENQNHLSVMPDYKKSLTAITHFFAQSEDSVSLSRFYEEEILLGIHTKNNLQVQKRNRANTKSAIAVSTPQTENRPNVSFEEVAMKVIQENYPSEDTDFQNHVEEVKMEIGQNVSEVVNSISIPEPDCEVDEHTSGGSDPIKSEEQQQQLEVEQSPIQDEDSVQVNQYIPPRPEPKQFVSKIVLESSNYNRLNRLLDRKNKPVVPGIKPTAVSIVVNEAATKTLRSRQEYQSNNNDDYFGESHTIEDEDEEEEIEKNQPKILITYDTTQNKKTQPQVAITYHCSQTNCEYKTLNYDRFKRHIQGHVKRKNCEYCDEKFRHKNQLNRHVISTHPNSKHAKNLHRRFHCSICKNVIFKTTELEAHELLHKNNITNPYSCVLCSEIFNTAVFLQDHVRKTHNSGPIKCDKCGKGYYNTQSLGTHFIKCKRTRVDLQCQSCGFQASSPNNLKNHMATKHGLSLNALCETCGKEFKTKNALEGHVKRVHEKRPAEFKCEFCGKGFYNKNSLMDHVRRHGTERPFKCHLCAHAFKTQNNLKQHLGVHALKKDTKSFRHSNPRKSRLPPIQQTPITTDSITNTNPSEQSTSTSTGFQQQLSDPVDFSYLSMF